MVGVVVEFDKIVGEGGVVVGVVVGFDKIVGERGVERWVVGERTESGRTAGAAHCTSEVVVDHFISGGVVVVVVVVVVVGYVVDVVGGVVGVSIIESVRIAAVAHFSSA